MGVADEVLPFEEVEVAPSARRPPVWVALPALAWIVGYPLAVFAVLVSAVHFVAYSSGPSPELDTVRLLLFPIGDLAIVGYVSASLGTLVVSALATSEGLGLLVLLAAAFLVAVFHVGVAGLLVAGGRWAIRVIRASSERA